MPWPNDVLTRTVTGNYLTATGSAAKGRITFTPTSRVIDENNAVIVEDPISATLDSSGAFTVALPTTDNPVLNPTGWAYEVVVRLHGLKPHKFFAFLPYGDGSSVNLNNDISTQPAVITHSPFAQFQVSTEESGAPQVWPSDVITRNVTGTYLTATGAAAQGRVTFTPTARVIDENDSIIIEDTITATLNASGAFTVALPTTDNPLLTPENWAYEVNVRIYGVRPRKFYILLPYGDGTDVDIINSVSTISSTVQDSTIQPSLLRGPVGPRGPGTIIGSGAPANSTGFDGDIYIDSDTGEYYGPKADGIWPTPAIFSIADVAGFNQRYIHTQTVAASTWSISHPLGGRPSVTIVDTGNTVVVGDIVYNSDTSVTVSFTTPFSGYAYLT